MIVVDSNILAYLYLPGEFTAHAENLLLADAHWIAPILWRSEFRNILAGYLRRKMLSYADVIAIQQEAELLLFENEFTVDSGQILQLVNQSDCSAYDCEFVALAKNQGINLVTMDKKILKNFPETTIALVNY